MSANRNTINSNGGDVRGTEVNPNKKPKFESGVDEGPSGVQGNQKPVFS